VEEEVLGSFDVLNFVAVVFFMIASWLPSFDGNYYFEMEVGVVDVVDNVDSNFVEYDLHFLDYNMQYYCWYNNFMFELYLLYLS
jgi:hypothetical protein